MNDSITYPIQPFEVIVYRAWWDDDSDTGGMDGWFVSKVYAIRGSEFLVYDDGRLSAYDISAGFIWVDFEESHTYRGFEMDGWDNKDGEDYRPRVYLVEGE